MNRVDKDSAAKALCLQLSYALARADPRMSELLRRVALDEYFGKLVQWKGRKS